MACSYSVIPADEEAELVDDNPLGQDDDGDDFDDETMDALEDFDSDEEGDTDRVRQQLNVHKLC